MFLDYNTSKSIVQRFYEDCFRYWYSAGMNEYQASRKAEEEVLELKASPYTEEGRLDVRACEDFVIELQGGVTV